MFIQMDSNLPSLEGIEITTLNDTRNYNLFLSFKVPLVTYCDNMTHVSLLPSCVAALIHRMIYLCLDNVNTDRLG